MRFLRLHVTLEATLLSTIELLIVRHWYSECRTSSGDHQLPGCVSTIYSDSECITNLHRMNPAGSEQQCFVTQAHEKIGANTQISIHGNDNITGRTETTETNTVSIGYTMPKPSTRGSNYARSDSESGYVIHERVTRGENN